MFGKGKEIQHSQETISTISNIIGKGTSIVGDIETAGNIRYDGKLKGNIRSKSKVVLGNGSHVEGNIYAQNAEIEGEVIGTIEIVDVLVLKASAVIVGDIHTARLVVESGAKFNGSCKMGEGTKQEKLETNARKTAQGA